VRCWIPTRHCLVEELCRGGANPTAPTRTGGPCAGNPDLGVREPMFHSTAAGMARYHHRDDIVALIEAT
jgi:hypothetical protein